MFKISIDERRNLENIYQCILSLRRSSTINTLFVLGFHPQISGEFLDCLGMSTTQGIESKNIGSAEGVSDVVHLRAAIST
jgi:hypothetical protein